MFQIAISSVGATYRGARLRSMLNLLVLPGLVRDSQKWHVLIQRFQSWCQLLTDFMVSGPDCLNGPKQNPEEFPGCIQRVSFRVIWLTYEK